MKQNFWMGNRKFWILMNNQTLEIDGGKCGDNYGNLVNETQNIVL